MHTSHTPFTQEKAQLVWLTQSMSDPAASASGDPAASASVDGLDALLLSAAAEPCPSLFDGLKKERALQELIRCGARVNARASNASNSTPLHVAAAARPCAPSCVKLLLEAHASVDAVDVRGSACHAALDQLRNPSDFASAEETFLVLLDAGADLRAAKDALARLERQWWAPTAEDAQAAFGPLCRQLEMLNPGMQLQTRLKAYMRGSVPPVSRCVDTSFTCVYQERPWSESSHRFCPPVMREVILMLLLASRRRKEGDAGWLPPELWQLCFRHMHRDWIDSAELRESRKAWEERMQRDEWERMRHELCLLNPMSLGGASRTPSSAATQPGACARASYYPDVSADGWDAQTIGHGPGLGFTFRGPQHPRSMARGAVDSDDDSDVDHVSISSGSGSDWEDASARIIRR